MLKALKDAPKVCGGWWDYQGELVWVVGLLPNGHFLVLDDDGDPFELSWQAAATITEVPGPTRWDHYHDLWLTLPDRLRRLPRRILYGREPIVPPPRPPAPPTKEANHD